MLKKIRTTVYFTAAQKKHLEYQADEIHLTRNDYLLNLIDSDMKKKRVKK